MTRTKIVGLAALGALMVLSAPVERAAALSLSNPAAALVVQDGAKMTTDVRWHYRHHWRRWHRWQRWHHRYW
jgi:hypothetical protein